MTDTALTIEITCKSCHGTGLYVGLAERDGAAVVCSTCTGTGRSTFTYEPFTGRAAAPAGVTSVHVARGYMLGQGHPRCDGGLPISEWEPGKTVPADEQLYCPFLYTGQEWCAKPETPSWGGQPAAPLLAGSRISDCKHWLDKADCWRRFHEGAPAEVKEQIS